MPGIISLRKNSVGASILALLIVVACGPAPSTAPTPTSTTLSQPTATESSTITAPLPTPTDIATPVATGTAEGEPTATANVGQPTPAPTADVGALEWKQVGLAGKRITDLAVAQGQTLDLVMAAAPHGAWVSKYGYTDWLEQKVSPASDDARDADADVASADVLYYTSHTGCMSGLPHNAWRSTDGGATWAKIDNEPISVVAADANIAYATSCSGILKTTDSGATWATLTTPQLSSDPISLATSPDGQTVYAAFVSEGGTGQIWTSKDGGATWSDVTPKNVPAEEGFVAPDLLTYVTGSVGRPDDGGLYLTNQQGIWHLPLESSTEWTLMKKPPIEGEPPDSYDWYTALLVDTNYATQVEKSGPILYVARAKPSEHAEPLNLGVWRSTDMGASWQRVGKEMSIAPVHSLALALTDSTGTGRGLGAGIFETLLAGTDDGVWALQR